MTTTFPLSLDNAATPVELAPGDEVIVRGSCYSSFDGTTIDAATTSWPANAPGGASVDLGGLVDFEAGGLHVSSRDPVKHEVHAVATGKTDVCKALGVASPCMPNRLQKLALDRRPVPITLAEMKSSLSCNVVVEVPAAAAYAPLRPAFPYLQVAGAALALGLAGTLLWRWRKKQASSPAGQLAALARRVREKLAGADAVFAAPLAPAVEKALRTLRERRVDPRSEEGKRVHAALVRVEARLDDSAQKVRAEEEQQAADELVREFESALEAADEATLAHKG